MKSPIETRLERALIPMVDALGWVLERQVYFPPYTADFLVTSDFSLVVECDGFEFHERTPEQAEKDRRRDRWFLRIGIPTVRFLGGEIMRNAEACATNVIQIASKLPHAIQRHQSPALLDEEAEIDRLADAYFNPYEPHPAWLER